MIVTVSAALLFGVITFVLVRTQRVSAGSMTAVWLSGFTAASTGLAGPVNQGLAAAAHMIATLH
ncbi:hypothetical protein [Kitasatospora sp. DSM 101779]|uniref:hypothetical protein n=1 Tax=Kitasatospora sp. DSM 101779 TaxID=2853165 RepID=UPI0021D96529|nr:hypothetical protein [Kitasatospora sp. DSM 101779]MCU7823860.1 hypothetical protein [Kitasatospora sp. DSM 101779]